MKQKIVDGIKFAAFEYFLNHIKKGDNSTLQTILQRSDDALYKAKENGRNQTIIY